jgi:uncharacterized protein YndB with AHSA1/START domain
MTARDGRTLCLEHTLPVPRPLAYAALTDQATLGEWWGPRGFTARAIVFDARVGGTYRIAMLPPDGDAFHLSGEFRRVEPPTCLAYTFRWEPPHRDDRETKVTLTLAESGDETRLRLMQHGFATEERRLLHEHGWSETLDRLECFLKEAVGRSACEGGRPAPAPDGNVPRLPRFYARPAEPTR